ncbi:MAG: A/G-specific adenine glycosylase [Magnetococcales bacterium]|nr:A/G-specific adenine glycosylase [Magnetococcales bacterium]
MNQATFPNTMAEKLLQHYDQYGRKLPWRGEKNLYRIWVSEIMLQQTAVATVIPYYRKFLQELPDVPALYACPEQQLLSLWQGLGYYRRAVQMHQGAKIMVNNYHGLPPEKLDAWLQIPGVGLSTAGAILAIGRNQAHAILDGNVKRVLARLLALESPIEDRQSQLILWKLAKQLTSKERPGDYAQAIMDLGALVCTRTQPKCSLCPWQEHCGAKNYSSPSAYPVRGTKIAKPCRWQICCLLVNTEGKLYVEQRPQHGLLASLWQPPCFDWPDQQSIPSAERVNTHLPPIYQQWLSPPASSLPVVKHAFTHFNIVLYPFLFLVADSPPLVSGKWLAHADRLELPMATLHRKVLKNWDACLKEKN